MSADTLPVDAVALTTRIRHLQLLRLGVAVAVLAWFGVEGAAAAHLPLVVGGHLAAAATAEVYWRWSRRRGLPVLNALLLLDGLVLVWTCTVTGGLASPLLPLVFAHAAAVALLASYRTGTKMALWTSLLLVVVHEAQGAGLLPGPAATGARLAALLVGLWAVVLTTASASAVNERELRRQRFDLDALSRLADDLERVHEATDVADGLLRRLVATFDLRRAVVLDADAADHRVLALVGGEAHGAPTGARGALHSPLLDEVASHRRTVLVRTLGEDEAALARLLPGATNLVLTPLRVDGRVNGVVVMEHVRPRVPARSLAMIERFCGHAALALANAALVTRLHTMAATDGLTGLRNRREFDAGLRRELAHGARTDTSTSLLLVDIDHFKRLNDTYGHQAGDDVLREVAERLHASCREVDLVARYGGEEFAVVLPRTGVDQAGEVAERIRLAIRDGGTTIPVTVSIGLATTHGAGREGADGIVAAADGALYAAKAAGRDTVRVGGVRLAVAGGAA